ncbi:peptidase C14, caspase domain-containing protein [Hysterangium stoloniferum]|nr:peptidase C14, caspase domain-containing protein [Hysterangium stoloniferum]
MSLEDYHILHISVAGLLHQFVPLIRLLSLPSLMTFIFLQFLIPFIFLALMKALCIGIRFPPIEGMREAKGAHEDVRNVAEFLSKIGYKVERLLDGTPGSSPPTRKNITDAFYRLTDDVRTGDRRFLLIAGHATQCTNLSGTERDGLDEVLLTCDSEVNINYPEDDDPKHWVEDTVLKDDDLHELLVKPMPAGSYLTVILDTCHSGTLLDLKYCICCHQILPEQSSEIVDSPTSIENGNYVLSPIHPPSPQNSFPIPKRRCKSLLLRNNIDYPWQADTCEGPFVREHNKFCWSACDDSQSAYGGKYGGVFCSIWLDCAQKYLHAITFRGMISVVHHSIKHKMESRNIDPKRKGHPQLTIQIPQFSSHQQPNLDRKLVDYL